MIVDASGREVLGGGGVLPVDVKTLGAELRRLWASSEPTAETTGARSVVRSCTRNVVVLAPDAAAAGEAAGLLAEVAERYPSRAFVVQQAAAEPDRLEATLEARCLMRGGGRHVCCEQVTLTVGARAGRRAASAIMPLLVPDLPVFVWTLGAPDWSAELLGRLLDVADQLLFDSRACGDPVRLLLDVARRERHDPWAPADLEWQRLADWREAVALLFDDPAAAALPARVSTVRVRHGAAGVAGAALLAGWILDRLAAARRGGAGERAGEESPVAVTLEAGSAGWDIERVRLEVVRPAATLEAERVEAADAIRLGISAPDSCALPGRLPCATTSTARLLETALAGSGADELYERALARAAILLDNISPDRAVKPSP